MRIELKVIFDTDKKLPNKTLNQILYESYNFCTTLENMRDTNHNFVTVKMLVDNEEYYERNR